MEEVKLLMEEILNKTFFEISVQNYCIAFGILVGFYILRKPLSKIVLGIIKKITGKTHTTIDDKIIDVLEGPFKFTFIILGFYFAKEWLKLETDNGLFDKIIHSLSIFVIFWIFYKFIHEFHSFFGLFSTKIGKTLNEDLENFIIKSVKVLIVTLGILMFIQAWGINITAFIASLGIGGLAIALAAKDTAANLFGSLVIFADRPFQLGDWVEIDGYDGVVTEIGIRSTKLRTFPQSIVTIPNATVANTSITNWERMGKRRVQENIGLTYDTSSQQIEKIMEDMKKVITENDKIHDDGILLSFKSFGDSSLNIFYRYFTKTTKYDEFLSIVQDMNIKFMHIVEKHGSSFAFPTQSLHVETLPKELIDKKEKK